jgi:hypothetical protein
MYKINNQAISNTNTFKKLQNYIYICTTIPLFESIINKYNESQG